MTLLLVSVTLDAKSSQGDAAYSARFSPGLNVLAAPNSWGKSTLLQSILYALGLEGMLSASRRVPLGPAMTSVIDLPQGRGTVYESSVELTITNDESFLRVRRYPASTDVQSNLVQVWQSDTEAGLDEAVRRDMYVREGGSATGDFGFHQLLATFLGWSLPSVPAYQGTEVLLYLETLFPLFWVEQKSGWSGIAPRVPTYLQIREPIRRAVEYVLGLHTLDLIKQRNALRDELQDITRSWTNAASTTRAALENAGFRALRLPATPVGTSQLSEPMLEVFIDDTWHTSDYALTTWTERLAMLGGRGVQRAGDRTEQSQRELAGAESAMRRIGSQTRHLQELLTLTRADLDALAARLDGIEADRRRLLDAGKVERLGGQLGSALLSDGACPTCAQEVDPRDVATHHVQSLAEALRALTAEQVTLRNLTEASRVRESEQAARLTALEDQLAESRNRVRLLRDELTSPSASLSLVEVREQLRLADNIGRLNSLVGLLETCQERLERLGQRLDGARAQQAELDATDVSREDQSLINEFSRRFSQQLADYGLRSLPASEVSISQSTLLPSNDGFELSFDISLGMSASDSIRTKWAYHLALMQTAQSSPSGHHPNLLVLDEPRQQETERTSLQAFISHMGQTPGQFVYATSEEPAQLEQLLGAVPHSRLESSSPHLLSPV